MKVTIFFFVAVSLLCISCKDSPSESNNDAESSIEILDLVPAPESTITSNDTIIAALRYSIADDIQSQFGFSISIKFVSTKDRQTFSIGSKSEIELTGRSGNVSLEYPLELIWSHSELKHPISCYFYLHNETSETLSTVFAKTAEITYKE